LIKAGDEPGDEKFRRGTIARFASIRYPVEAERTLKNSLLLPPDKTVMAALAPLADLSMKAAPVGTPTTEFRLAVLPSSEVEKLSALVQERSLWFETVARDRRLAHILLAFPRDLGNEIELVLKELKAAPVSLDVQLGKACSGDRVGDILERNEVERARISADIAALEDKMKALAVHKTALMSVHDILLNEREKTLAAGLLGETEKVICLEGWVRAADKERLASRVASVAEAAHVYFRQPLPEEEPPVILENAGIAKPFEIITGLYGLPQRGHLDPTVPLAPFFFLFVGLCVSEGGYGFLVTVLSLLYLKFGRPSKGARLFAKLALYLGLSNIVLGTLFGGWFGFPIRSLLLIDSLKDPISFLGLSLLLGFIQVWFGTLLSMVNAIRNKAFAESIVKGGWLLLLPALVLFFVVRSPLAGILAIAGASAVVLFANPSRNPLARFFGGLYSLYGISGYLSDTLSYSRILALGLATGVIGMVVNNLTQTAFKIPVAGWVLAPLIFVGGHLFNLGISFLGGFVHSMRLQFVEFFTKFYKGGGKPFKAFRLENKYMEFVE
jgi:V/A-type H+-transporting ATPase subunit I